MEKINIQEYVKNNDIKDLDLLVMCEKSFDDEDFVPFRTNVIVDKPSEYTNILSEMDNLKKIYITGNNGNEFYKQAKDFISKCNNDVEIFHDTSTRAIATKEDFLKGEEIIENIISEIDQEWTTKQKAAFVHYKMGEVVSYSPDYNFSEKYKNDDKENVTRNVWKSLVNCESVCSGITFIQRNILSRLGINSKELSSGTHSFLLVETEEGNIITDATWDLNNSLYGARPMYFGRTYEQLREEEKGISNSHRLKDPPENVIEIQDEELREIYYSIGLTKENRNFKFPLLDKLNEINEQNFNNTEEKVNCFLEMFSNDFQENITHKQETRQILENCLCYLGINNKDINTRFVYSKEDKECLNPNLVLHINSVEEKDIVRYLDFEKKEFEKMDLKEFDKNYKIHDEDKTAPFWKKHISKDEINQNIEKEVDKEFDE